MKRSRWLLAAGIVLLTICLLTGIYNWLVHKEAIAGREHFTNLALFVPAVILLRWDLMNFNRRWQKNSLLALALASGVLYALGTAGLFYPLSKNTQGTLEIFNMLSLVTGGIIQLIVSPAIKPPQEPLPRKRKIIQTIIVIAVLLAAFALIFSLFPLSLYLFTRNR